MTARVQRKAPFRMTSTTESQSSIFILVIRMSRRNESTPSVTDPSMCPDLWLAPVRNLVWVAARFGHR